MQLFGFELRRKKEEEITTSIVSPENTDGAMVVDNALAGFYTATLDLDSAIKSETDLIRRYRQIALYSDCDSAIDEIINEVVVSNDGTTLVELDLEDVDLPETIKTKFQDEFKYILRLLDFQATAYDLVRDWYIDGRMHFYVILGQNPKDGIKELRYIDSRKIKKVKNIKKGKTKSGVDIITDVDEYYIYNDKGIVESNTVGSRLSLDSVIYSNSGFVDKNSGMILSFLNKAIKLVNQLKYIEDSIVIYRISRAPERRIFYIDVDGLNKMKSEQHVAEQMAKYKNKIVYDATTGEVSDAKRHLSMMEDFWMPRRSNKTTEITTLPGGMNLGNIEDINFFQNKLYKALNVPMSRMQSQQGVFDIGHSSAISRDEVKFAKFIDRLRNKFSKIFTDALRVQLVSKGIISLDDWEEIRLNVKYDYQKDNLYAELKDTEILNSRLGALAQADQYVGKYFDDLWVRKTILKQSDEDIKKIDARNKILAKQQAQLQAEQQAAMQPQEQEEQEQEDQYLPPQE